MNNGQQRIQAFTIMEVTMVLAIMSVLISIVFVALNRFNEQLKVANEISQELNDWRMVRSTIWKDFYEADSIQCQDNLLTIYSKGKILIYSIKKEQLHRQNNGVKVNLKFEVASIHEKMEDEHRTFYIEFVWKGELMTLSYLYNPSIDLEINNYFYLIE